MVFEGFINGIKIFSESIQILFKHPIFALPLLFVWIILAPIMLYFYFFFDADIYSTNQILLIVFGVIYVYSFLFTFSCVVMLELIQQYETGKKLNFVGAVLETIHKDLIGIIVISLLWAIIWFVLTVIQAILSSGKKRSRSSRPPPSPQEAARVLSGQTGTFSWLRLGISMIKKLVRLIVYLILPAIAWEDQNIFGAFKRGFIVLKSHVAEFMIAYTGSVIASIIVYLPIILTFNFVPSAPDFVWYAVIAYTTAAWVFSMYLEQMNMALLFLWHKKWEAATKKAEQQGKPIPSLGEISKPSLLDEVPDLVE